MKYYVYSKGILGLTSNRSDFKWSFGTSMHESTQIEYENCKIKVSLIVCNDLDVFSKEEYENLDVHFRYFAGNKNSKTIFYNRPILPGVCLKGKFEINDCQVNAVVGKSYYFKLGYKIMNMHSVDYVLSDFVTCLLIKNGLVPLYCSAVKLSNGRSVAIFAPPNSGKTRSALKLCDDYGARFISEDIAITDGDNVFAVPWTNTYRKYENQNYLKNDVSKIEWNTPLNNIVILETKNRCCNHIEVCKKIKLLNRYGLGYYRSPIVIAFNYFNDNLIISDLTIKETEIINTAIKKCNILSAIETNNKSYADDINDLVTISE